MNYTNILIKCYKLVLAIISFLTLFRYTFIFNIFKDNETFNTLYYKELIKNELFFKFILLKCFYNRQYAV